MTSINRQEIIENANPALIETNKKDGNVKAIIKV